MQNYIEISILPVKNNSFTGPLIIGTFEKRAPGLRTRLYNPVPSARSFFLR